MLKMAVAASCAPRMEMRLLSGPSNKISLVVLLDVTCGLALLWAVVINTFYFMSLRTFAYAVPWCCPVFFPFSQTISSLPHFRSQFKYSFLEDGSDLHIYQHRLRNT